MSPAQAVKTEVPIQLFSTTNQPHKVGGLQQQIPTKLAAHSKGSKSSRSHHRSSHQRAGQHTIRILLIYIYIYILYINIYIYIYIIY